MTLACVALLVAQHEVNLENEAQARLHGRQGSHAGIAGAPQLTGTSRELQEKTFLFCQASAGHLRTRSLFSFIGWPVSSSSVSLPGVYCSLPMNTLYLNLQLRIRDTSHKLHDPNFR